MPVRPSLLGDGAERAAHGSRGSRVMALLGEGGATFRSR